MNQTNIQTLLILLCLFCQSKVIGHDLTGRWKWANDKMEADVFFSEDRYFMEAYLKGTKSQISEGFSYFMIIGDTLIFNKVPVDEGREPLSYHLISSFTPDKMVLIDLKNGKKDQYYRVDYDQRVLKKYRNDEFYYGGGGIVCISDKLDGNDNHCLNFGGFSLNSTLEEIEQILGKPYDKMSHGGKFYNVYLLKELKNGSQPYIAVELLNGQVKSIQITGEASIEELSFSSISLGDYYTFVEQKLGPPSDTGLVDDETTYWDYAPFTFSFEIKNNLVYSIKLTKQIAD